MAAIDPAWKSHKELADAQAGLKEAIRLADDAIYGAKSQMPSSLNQITDFRINDAVGNWELHKRDFWDAANNGMLAGRSVSPSQMITLLRLVKADIAQVQQRVELARQYTITKSLGRAVLDVVGAIAERLNAAAQAVEAIIDALLNAVKATAAAINWLPILIVAAIAVPFVLRVFVAGKKGGTTAAFEAAAGQIERGRSAAWEGAKRAGGVAAKAAAAYATKGKSLAVSGSPRRHSRR